MKSIWKLNRESINIILRVGFPLFVFCFRHKYGTDASTQILWSCVTVIPWYLFKFMSSDVLLHSHFFFFFFCCVLSHIHIVIKTTKMKMLVWIIDGMSILKFKLFQHFQLWHCFPNWFHLLYFYQFISILSMGLYKKNLQ